MLYNIAVSSFAGFVGVVIQRLLDPLSEEIVTIQF